jgi:hypothetical protein
MRATIGGNPINYPDDVGTPTANLLLIKIFLNSVILTKGAKFIRNGFMPHIMGHKLSHIYAREVR